MERLVLFCSGSGTNAQAMMDYFAGHPSIQVVGLLANSAKAFALERAAKAGLPTMTVNRHVFYETDQVDTWLADLGATCLVLAGFLWLVPERLLAQYPGRVVNVHPALLPDFGGEGMYGRRVHEAVAAAGRSETGITVHLADEAYDRGRILFQARETLPAGADADAVEAVARRLELAHYPKAVEAYLIAGLSQGQGPGL